MKPIVIKSNALLKRLSWFFPISGITLYPFIIVRENVHDVTLSHEKIHIAQCSDFYLFPFLFYLVYLYDWVVGLIRYRSKTAAYYKIRFEQEAYMYEHDLDYWENRKMYSWRHFKI